MPTRQHEEDETPETWNDLEGRDCTVLYRIVPARDGWPEASRDGFTAFRESTVQSRLWNTAAMYQMTKPAPLNKQQTTN